MIMPEVCLCQSILPVKRLEMRTLSVKFLKQTGKMILLFVVYTRICRRIRCSLTTLLSPSIGMEDIREDMAGREMMSFYTFLRLRNAADIDKVNDNIQRVIEKYTPAQYDDWKMNFSVIPLVKYHLISSDVQKAFDHIWLSGIRYLLCGHHELYADIYCHPKPSCQRSRST